MPAVLTLGARRELAVALQRIAEDNADAAEQLNDAVHEAARLIGANPAVGARRPRLASARFLLVDPALPLSPGLHRRDRPASDCADRAYA